MTMFSSKTPFDLKAFLAQPAAPKGTRKRGTSTFAKAQKARQEQSRAAAEAAEAPSED